MGSPRQKMIDPKLKLLIRITYVTIIFVLAIVAALTVFVLKTKEYAFVNATQETVAVVADPIVEEQGFPFGVNPIKETIDENPLLDSYFSTHIKEDQKIDRKVSWLRRTIGKLAQLDWYQNLASPISRILVIEPGARREQVTDDFGDILRWTTEERALFTSTVASSSPELIEGKFFPGHYVVNKDATPSEVASVIIEHFDSNIASHYSDELQKIVPLNDTMTIASLLEREAYDFEDMRYISGVIWNRLFIGMNLQIDASLQYAKVNGASTTWWPPARPKDKYIDSPFNTYKHEGLPPSPIANPSVAAVLAALNPRETDCMFYFHDKDGGFHCTVTYEEHVALLKKYYKK